MYLFGASGHGKVIKEIIEAAGGRVVAFVDDNPMVGECAGVSVRHEAEGCEPMMVSIGVNAVRRKVVERLDCEFGVAIHPTAVVSPSARIGEGTVVMAGAVVNAEAVIGKHCIINTGATVDHECVIGDYCHVAPGAHLCGQVKVGEGTLMVAPVSHMAFCETYTLDGISPFATFTGGQMRHSVMMASIVSELRWVKTGMWLHVEDLGHGDDLRLW